MSKAEKSIATTKTQKKNENKNKQIKKKQKQNKNKNKNKTKTKTKTKQKQNKKLRIKHDFPQEENERRVGEGVLGGRKSCFCRVSRGLKNGWEDAGWMEGCIA